MGAYFLHPDYPRDVLKRDSAACPPDGVHIVEAWPGSVTTECYTMANGRVNRFIDGVAIRIIGEIPDEVIAVGLWLVPPEKVEEFRAQSVFVPEPPVDRGVSAAGGTR